MIASITAFVAGHLKHIVTFGFIIGLMSLLVRLVDDKLSGKHKKQIGDWIEDKTLRVDAVTIQGMYAFCRRARFAVPGILSVFGVVILYITFPKNEAFGIFLCFAFLIVLITFGLYLLVVKVLFDKPTIGEAADPWIRRLGYVLGTVVIPLVWRAIRMKSVSGLTSNAILGRGVVPSGVFAVTLLAAIPFLLLLVVRLPILAASKALWWIATHPKGPWGGLVALLTFGLGILRLLM